jgi:UTP--glucose-1-phosphate uridylyltransferase
VNKTKEPKIITKAVIAAAGFGTRFLPQTKAMPKEMLPIIDKPIIQYVVEELVAVGVKDIIIVTGYSKRSIEDHFDKPSEDLLANLRLGGPQKAPLLKEVEAIADLANFVYIRQKGPYGNGTPLLNTEHLLGKDPFYFTWSDDFIEATPLRFKQMLDAYNKYNCPVMSTVKLNYPQDYDRYGIAGGQQLDDNCIQIDTIAEKPGKAKAPSDNATVSGCILVPEYFGYLHKTLDKLPSNKELYYNDALKLMLKDNKKIVACQIENAKYHDAGDKLEYLKTVFDFAIKDTDIGPELKEYLTKHL